MTKIEGTDVMMVLVQQYDTLNSTKNNLILLDLLILLRNPGLQPSVVTQIKLCMYNVHMYIGLTSTQMTYMVKK